jgi:hypothetical protein
MRVLLVDGWSQVVFMYAGFMSIAARIGHNSIVLQNMLE